MSGFSGARQRHAQHRAAREARAQPAVPERTECRAGRERRDHDAEARGLIELLEVRGQHDGLGRQIDRGDRHQREGQGAQQPVLPQHHEAAHQPRPARGRLRLAARPRLEAEIADARGPRSRPSASGWGGGGVGGTPVTVLNLRDSPRFGDSPTKGVRVTLTAQVHWRGEYRWLRETAVFRCRSRRLPDRGGRNRPVTNCDRFPPSAFTEHGAICRSRLNTEVEWGGWLRTVDALVLR